MVRVDPAVTVSGGDGMDRPRRPGRRWIGMAAKLALSAIVLAAIVSRVDMAGIGHSLAGASASGLALAGAAFLAMPLLGGVRWWVALRGIGEAGRLGALTVWFSTATVAAQVAPSVAGDAVRIWLAARRGHALGPTIQSVFLDRVFLVLSLLVLALAGAPLLQARTGETAPVWICTALLLAGLGGLGALMAADRIDFGLSRLRPWAAIMAAAPTTRGLVLSHWGAGLALGSLLSNLNFALAGFLLARALGLPTTLSDFLAFIPMVTLAVTLPISFGGWGVREGLLVMLLGRVGVPASDALALSLLFGAGNMLCGMPGLAAWLLEGRLAARAPAVVPAVAAPPA